MRPWAAFLLLVGVGIPGSVAWPMSLYLETGLGAGNMLFASPLFGSSIPDVPSPGYSANVVFGFNFSDEASFLQTHLTLQARQATSYDNGNQFALLSVYPGIRFEFPRLYLGAGATPLVFTRTGPGDFGINYQFGTASFSALFEAGLVWRVVPFFHFIIGAAAQLAMGSGGLGPKPAWEGTVQLRFFLWNRNPAKETSVMEKKRRSMDGWRYPFGIWKDERY